MAVHAVVLVKTTGIFQRFNNSRYRDFIYRVGTAFNAALH